MLKRGAHGDHMRREEEGVLGMASTPDEKPQRATAAQLANRKIKDVRKRRAATPTAGAGAPETAFNPFAGAAAPAQTQSSGFPFGQAQSQSFPGASSGPNQGGIFSSGTNGQAAAPAPFSFGGGSTSFGSAPSSNPFSVDTSFGGSTQPSSNGFSFGGFNAGGQQSVPSFGGFGAQPNTSTPASTPASTGLFGKSVAHIASPADDSMQTSPDTKPKGDSMFSPKPAAGGSTFSNPFANISGQSTSTNIFAPPKTTLTEQSAAKPAESQPFKPLFGSTAAAPKPSDAQKEQPPASNPFANLSGQTSANSSNIFAPKAPVVDGASPKPADSAKPFGSLFGSTPSTQPSGPASNLFAPKPAAEEAKASNPFGNLSAPTSFGAMPSPTSFGAMPSPKVTGIESPAKAAEAQPFKPLFGTPAASKVAEADKGQTPPPAFNNIFSPKPAAETAAEKPAAEQPFKSLFGTPATSKAPEAAKESAAAPAFGNMFSPKPAAEGAAAKPIESQPFKSLFGTPATPKPAGAEKEPAAASNIFAPKVTSEEQTTVPAKTPQLGSVFGSPAPSKLGEAQNTQATPSNPFSNLSGAAAFNNPFAPKPTEQAAKSQTPSTSLFGASAAIGSNKDNKENKDNGAAALGTSLSNPFAASAHAIDETHKESATEATAQASSKFSHDASKDTSSLALPSSSSFSLPSSTSTSTVTNPPTPSDLYLASDTFIATDADSRFPRPDHPPSLDYPEIMPLKNPVPGAKEINPRHQTEAALLWKLRMLTESFKREVAKCDPMTDDIDDVILLYVDLRRELGIPIGAIDPDEEHERTNLDETEAYAQAPPTEVRQRASTPESFTIPRTRMDEPAIAKNPETGSSTVSKFAQSFSSSAPASAPVTDSAGAAAAAAAAAAPSDSVSTTPVSETTGSVAATAATAPVSTTPVSEASATPAPVASFTPPTPAGIPKFGGGATSTSASTATSAFQIPKFDGGGATSAPASAFKVPKFGAASGTDFMAQFKAKAEKTAAEEKAKRKAEDFDSDEENEEEWERKDAERQREKKAEAEAAAKKRAVFVPGVGFKFVDQDSAAAPTDAAAPTNTAAPTGTAASTDAPAPTDATSNAASAATTPTEDSAATLQAKPANPPSLFATTATSSVFGSGAQPVPASQNIFGSIKPTMKRKASTDDTDNEDELPAKKSKSIVPSDAGGSLFGRVASPPAASNTALNTAFPPAASKNPFKTPFPPTPPKPAPNTSVRPAASAMKRKASTDDTDNEDELPAKKTASKNPFKTPCPPTLPSHPTLPFPPTLPKPAPNTYVRPAALASSFPSATSLFGAPAASTASFPPAASNGLFGTSPRPSASPFGTPAASTPLFPPPAPFSGFGQAAPANASPQPAVATPSAQGGEPTASTEEDDVEAGEIFDLTRANTGEEEENVLFEDKTRAFKLDSRWASVGTGPVRLLQHPVTGRARIVARAEPSGKVVLNTYLKKELDYKLTTNSVQFLVPEEGGNLRHWALRVKRERLQEFYDLINKSKN
ncbi:uncharacterized protein N7515_003169 [Penicillium bovifimosum]|uniref:RanBD1 domain-containing protein n=1 Tax=Penicillium bovifimosum TaxID=126998 RepID=A0A9W9H610_9EURO|nr:uncharacterized protein N7515_003169 [Penicillium bovifimosum]KAJ5138321.1 hypothetical protein N7515_003169 [Penicillium bovifimosum]